MKRSNGFTMIELLISTAMLMMISTSVFYLMMSYTKQITMSADKTKTIYAVRLITEKMSNDIIQSGGAAAGSGTGKLVIGDVNYELKDGRVRRQEGSEINYLNTEGEINFTAFLPSYPAVL